MRNGNRSSLVDASIETRCDALTMGRLGRELASVYGETLVAPLPASLQALIERLENAFEAEPPATGDPRP